MWLVLAVVVKRLSIFRDATLWTKLSFTESYDKGLRVFCLFLAVRRRLIQLENILDLLLNMCADLVVLWIISNHCLSSSWQVIAVLKVRSHLSIRPFDAGW